MLPEDAGTENDTPVGDLGDDLLRGGDGDDSLIGGAGNDLLAGNSGVDSIPDATATINQAFTFSAFVLSVLEASSAQHGLCHVSKTVVE